MEVLRLVSKEAPLDCVACVILYNNPTWMIENVVSSFLDTKMNVKLYIIDNSPTPLMKPDPSESRVFYHFVGQNLGYGKAQNWCIRRCEPTKYFLVLNPDVIISKGTIDELCRYLDKDPSIGMVCPRVLNKDQTLQHLNKRRPNLTDLFLRRFYTTKGPFPFIRKRLDHYEMRDIGYEDIYEVPFMTGAFMLCRADVLKKVDGFDPRFFMYFEDADLSRKFQKKGYRTIYYPHVHITHFWKRESQKSLKMALVFMISGFKYFHKWGWKLY